MAPIAQNYTTYRFHLQELSLQPEKDTGTKKPPSISVKVEDGFKGF